MSCDYPENIGDFEEIKNVCPFYYFEYEGIEICNLSFEDPHCEQKGCPALALFKAFGLL